jgi:hypothetical protein
LYVGRIYFILATSNSLSFGEGWGEAIVRDTFIMINKVRIKEHGYISRFSRKD